jgi:hypothetical protein
MQREYTTTFLGFTIDDIRYRYDFFPYQSLLNLRHWRKAPKSLKLFFQALACVVPISNQSSANSYSRVLSTITYYYE